MMVTCAVDKSVTLWDTQNSNSGEDPVPPLACGNKGMGVGKLYSVSFYPSSPWLLGCGGSGNELALWDLREEAAVQNRFGDRVANAKNFQQTTASSEENGGEGQKEANFEAMMAAGDTAAADARSKAAKKKKKKGKKAKEKVHQKGD